MEFIDNEWSNMNEINKKIQDAIIRKVQEDNNRLDDDCAEAILTTHDRYLHLLFIVIDTDGYRAVACYLPHSPWYYQWVRASLRRPKDIPLWTNTQI